MTQGQFRVKAAFQLNYKVRYSREGKWLLGEIPDLNLATQGETPKELEENLIDLVKDYMEDPHTPKPIPKIQITFKRASSPRGVLTNAQTHTTIKA